MVKDSTLMKFIEIVSMGLDVQRTSVVKSYIKKKVVTKSTFKHCTVHLGKCFSTCFNCVKYISAETQGTYIINFVILIWINQCANNTK